MSEALFFAWTSFAAAWCICAYYSLVIRRAPFYHPINLFLAYFLVGYAYSAFADWYLEHSFLWQYTGVHPTASDVYFTAFISNVGLFTFVFVPPLLVRGVHTGLEMPRTKLVVANKHRFALAAVFFTILGLIGTRYTIPTDNTVLGYRVAETLTGEQRLVDLSGYQTLPSHFLVALLMIWYFRSGVTRLNVLVTILYTIVRFYQGNERFGFLALGFSLVIAIAVRRGIRLPKLRYLAFALVLAAAFDILGTNRLAIRDVLAGNRTFGEVVQEYQTKNSGELPLANLREFDCTAMVVALVPDATGFNWFTQYLRLFIWPIPRYLWPDKPVYTANIVWPYYGRFFGQTISMMGDAYSNCGLMSLVLVMALYGIGLSFLYKRAQITNSPAVFLANAIFAISTPVLFRDGEVGAYLFIFAWLFVALCFSRFGGLRLARAAREQ
ncbi:hypothetical protein [Bradyrhizobium vignae]|uniref:hypothetical protein n=1 Tax=Bradyrhizobium vignae TaxID=1549949 RepID=UPI00100A4C87|nr:hypothetical protein [Bradyrhizobium vignae]RXG85991.1 hypothetical protein EAV90_34440 [Bradyrhizobium vignae]